MRLVKASFQERSLPSQVIIVLRLINANCNLSSTVVAGILLSPWWNDVDLLSSTVIISSGHSSEANQGEF
jgi:hypothetical protein